MAKKKGITVANAYYQLIPSLEGAQKEITEELVPAAKKSGEKSGEKAGESFKSKMLKAIGALAVGKAIADGLSSGFEQSQVAGKLAASMNLTDQQAKVAGSVAGDLYSSGFGDSVTEVGASVEAVMSSLGKDLPKAQLKDLTKNVSALGRAFEVDVAESAQTANALIVNGLAKDGSEAMDLLTVAMQKMPAQVRNEALPALTEYSKHFAAVGIDGEQAISMLVSASSQGIIGVDKMGDAVKEFSIRATDMSTSTSAVYEALGLDTQEMTNALLAGGDSASEATSKIVEGLLSITDPGEQAAASLALFGTPLEDLGTDKIPDFLKSMSGANAELGDVSGAAGRLNDQLGPQVSSFEQMKRSLMGVLSEGLKPLLPVLQGFADWAKRNPGLLKVVVAGVGLLATALGVAAAAQWAMNSALLASPITWIIAAIAALVAGLVYFFTQTEVGRKAWEVFTNALAKGWEWVSNLFMSYLDLVVSVWRGAWDTAVALFNGAWEGIKAIAGWIVDMFLNWTLPGLIIQHWDTIKAKTESVWNGLKTFFSAIPGAIAGYFSTLGNTLATPFVSAWDVIKSTWETLKTWFGGLGATFVNSMAGVKDAIFAPFKAAFNAIAKAWNNSVGKLSFTVPDIIGMPKRGEKISMPKIPMLATGGTAMAPGWSLIGEQGPELLHMPRGASVVPLDHPMASASVGSDSAGLERVLRLLDDVVGRPVVVKVGERTLFEAIADLERRFGGR